MNRCDPPTEGTGPESVKDHFAKCPRCVEEMAEDRELVELIQQSLRDSLEHQTPSPEVWNRIRARLPDQRRDRWGEHIAGAWPRLLSNAVVVGLLIAFMGLIIRQPSWPGERHIASLPTAPQTNTQTPALLHEDEKPIAVAAPSSGTGTFDAMASEGLLNVGYLNHLQRHPRPRWKAPREPRAAVTEDNSFRNPPQ
jgi:hypothetical protein